ncbi:MAG: hypothetical protein IPJ61_17505 [Tessaracoccus sp.]|uniref:hypothetical protein n=1 Tax=Tessaracoccus sp. TaxID=1971211 RepID=UPI001EB667DC|nr:hypothetical protein [Tessaracoccus sp.]MBK7822803.1 hypothetical protein [Tessaracoccus sp.]
MTELNITARALLALFPSLPWSPRAEADRQTITIESVRTNAELLAEQDWDLTDETVRYQHAEAIEAGERRPGEHWRQHWDVSMPSRKGWAADWSVEDWARYEAKRLPAGYLPVATGVGAFRREVPSEVIAGLRAEWLAGDPVEQVRAYAARVDEAVDALHAAQTARDDAIRTALGAGVPVDVVVQASGVKRARVYQIRAGKA